MVSSFTLKNRLLLFVLMVIITILLGSLGYILIKVFVEHQSVTITDAIYFSVVTISTLGHYSSGMDLTSQVGKWFTIIYLIFGLGVIFGGIQALLGPWIEVKVKNAVQGKKLPVPEEGHVIIAGYNEVADFIIEELDMLGIPFVIVDENVPSNYPGVAGKPTEMENLIRANIERARALLAIGDNETNAVSVITARSLNENISIIALAQNSGAAEIIRKCGANVVMSRAQIISAAISHWINNDFAHILTGEIFGDMAIEEMKIEEENITIEDFGKRHKEGIIIGVYRGGNFTVNPPSKFMLKRGDVIIIFRGGA